jgi:hypothetical protein
MSNSFEGINPIGFWYLEERRGENEFEYYEYFKSGVTTYKVKLFCSDCEPILASDY